MNADGSKQHRLTIPAGGNSPSAAWSPDGRRIAFQSGSGTCILDGHFVSERNAGTGDVDISVANADGSGLRRVTSGPGVDCAPAWSPDGRKIAFQRSLVRREGDRVVGYDFDIYVINANSSEERNLTGDAVSAGSPLWSPDGRKIVFWSGPDGNGWVSVMNADGSKRRKLARNHGYVAWSPDGTKILLARGGHQLCEAPCSGGGGATEAYAVVANADGSGLRTLTRIAGVNGARASWSPDGRRIVFVSDLDGNLEIYVINADGSRRRNLTRHPGHDSDPAWAPATEDRLRDEARRQLRDLRHERGRERAAQPDAQPRTGSLPRLVAWAEARKLKWSASTRGGTHESSSGSPRRTRRGCHVDVGCGGRSRRSEAAGGDRHEDLFAREVAGDVCAHAASGRTPEA